MRVTLAHFRQEGQFTDWIASFHAEWMKLVKSSAFSFVILVVTSPFREVLDMSKDLLFSRHNLVLQFQNWKSCFHDKIFLLLWFLDGFYFSQNKSYWITPTGSIPSTVSESWTKRNFEGRNSISEKCNQSFCNFFFINYAFILFNERYF